MTNKEIKEKHNIVFRTVQNDVLSKGAKFDSGKPRMDLIPPEAMIAMGTVLSFGAEKYDDRNWEKGMDWGRVMGACLRHLTSWWGGKDKDPETGYSHLWHAFVNIAFLLTYEQRQIGKDDRNIT